MNLPKFGKTNFGTAKAHIFQRPNFPKNIIELVNLTNAIFFIRSNVDIDFNEISREINSFILSTKSRVEIFVSWYRELVNN